ncbi:MAG: hypothetical protein IKS72_05700 [Prevotella sp.]|nr:hypothetical protein [Prevotella sp.]
MQNNCHLSTLIHEQAKKYGAKPVLNTPPSRPPRKAVVSPMSAPMVSPDS